MAEDNDSTMAGKAVGEVEWQYTKGRAGLQSTLSRVSGKSESVVHAAFNAG